jgi:hypothetical protein
MSNSQKNQSQPSDKQNLEPQKRDKQEQPEIIKFDKKDKNMDYNENRNGTANF